MFLNKYLLFCLLSNEKIITNINLPSCKNCIHYKPSFSDSKYGSTFGKCEKFGVKNIITDKIEYDYVDTCRNDEVKCGKSGFYFEEDKNVNRRIIVHKLLYNLPYGVPLVILMANIIANILK